MLHSPQVWPSRFRGLSSGMASCGRAGAVNLIPVAKAQSEKKSDSRSATAGPWTTTDRSTQKLESGVGPM